MPQLNEKERQALKALTPICCGIVRHLVSTLKRTVILAGFIVWAGLLVEPEKTVLIVKAFLSMEIRDMADVLNKLAMVWLLLPCVMAGLELIIYGRVLAFNAEVPTRENQSSNCEGAK